MEPPCSAWLGYLHFSAEALRTSLVVRERNLGLRRTLRALSARLERAAHLDGAWQGIRPVLEALGADVVSLSLRAEVREFRTARVPRLHIGDTGRVDPVIVRLPLELAGVPDGSGVLQVAWHGHAAGVDRDDEIFLERLVRRLDAALGRICRQAGAGVAAASEAASVGAAESTAPAMRDAS